MTDAKLKSCYRCGKPPTLCEDDSYGYAIINCLLCEAEGVDICAHGPTTDLDLVIAAWNKRTPIDEAKERERFEKLFVDRRQARAHNGEYANPYFEHMWRGFIAAKRECETLQTAYEAGWVEGMEAATKIAENFYPEPMIDTTDRDIADAIRAAIAKSKSAHAKSDSGEDVK